MQAVNLRWPNRYGLDLLSPKVAGAEGQPGGPAGLGGQRFGAVHGARAVTLSDQTLGTHHLSASVCFIQLSACRPSRLSIP